MNKNFHNIKRIICFVLFAFLCFSLLSCSVSEWLERDIQDQLGDENELVKDIDYSVSFTLARYSGEKLDPYLSSDRVNRDLLSLCYDPLVFCDAFSNLVTVTAVDYTATANTVVFTLDPEARFSDGTSVTAEDCVYSYELAKRESSVYKDRFIYISGFEALPDGRFAVYFFRNSVYNVNMCDIPIVKKGTDGNLFATGSGKYVIMRDNSSVYLEMNPFSSVRTDENFAISKIEILSISSEEELLYNFNYNKIHGAYTDITDDGNEFRGNIETVSFCDNSMVYIVVNKKTSYSFLSDPRFSEALSYCINRTDMCASILSGGTKPVWYPFNPDWYVTVNSELNKDIFSTIEAHSLFSDVGVILEETVRTYNGEPVVLEILVNSENLRKVEVAESVAEDLESMGFDVTVKSLTWDKFLTAFEDCDYDICIAETYLPQNMDISILFDSEVNSGLGDVSAELLEAVERFNLGEIEMREFLSIFQSELPVIPLYFNRGALAVNRVVSGSFNPSRSNIYYGIENWVFS